MSGEPLRVERHGEVVRLVLDRPQAANALDEALQTALVNALAAADADVGVRAIVLAAAGERVFSAGADMKEYTDIDAAAARRRRRELLCRTVLALIDCGKPLVAAVRGKAIGGGCMLALLADEVHAARDATFSLPAIKLGMITTAGATIVAACGGRRAAQRLTLTGEAIAAAEAQALGLVTAVHDPERVDAAALARARALSSLDGRAYRESRRWLNASLRVDVIRAFDASARLQAEADGAAGAQ